MQSTVRKLALERKRFVRNRRRRAAGNEIEINAGGKQEGSKY
jgi:hypothetical protein